MPELVVDEAGVVGVGLGGKPDQAVPVDVDSEGVEAGDEHVQPHVELVAVDQEGLLDVSLDDGGLLGRLQVVDAPVSDVHHFYTVSIVRI